MPSQITTDDQALRLFFTDDIYLVGEPQRQPETILSPVEAAPVITAERAAVKNQETPAPGIPAIQVFKTLGGNKRNILILVNDTQNEVSDEKGRELLRKIVKSINLTASDFALLNYADYPATSFAQLKSHFSSVLVFAFGVSADQLGLSAQPENTLILHEGTRLIFSAGLSELDSDPNGKKLLWGCLKQLGL